ncbi:TIGR03621 family F420-dependent LLM class oxidoreductase [Nocardia sp. CDC159]|uniref:TIGR03621 family F420-dependent LLM class oxidoreductase n=1 Tax=Nocardia pulmonis TaxID=2951408 RepID=A0A9X2E592_9NOCA|nr:MULTISPECIES: TIGR03621 family F420-dependent LLM class oxidoreductase [Nocardia]MCM6774049.1 TIGR03621 family F420-dependent LLM class oxidoreductase [Nocardia pulmonis]MCM6786936.1 TIGR03621 family F420-dependent LLM class oxidoreductase [Nocardia sp. CDC159]
MREFRFGVSMRASDSRGEWQQAARLVEDLGFDTLLVPDHLGMVAPFPALMSAAEVTSRVRLGTFVLNAAFHRPALLARDVAAVDQLSDGRFELGLGAGYARDEFEAAGLSFPSAGERISHLEQTIVEVRRLLADPSHRPRPARPDVPIAVAGQGDRLLSMGARLADTVGLAGVVPGEDPTVRGTLPERIALLRRAAGERIAELEINMMVLAVHITGSGAPNLAFPRFFYPDYSDEQLLTIPNVLHGSEDEIADTLRHFRAEYGITYFTLTSHDMHAFAKVMARLR